MSGDCMISVWYMIFVSRTGFISGKILFEVWLGFCSVHTITKLHFRITFMQLLLQESAFTCCMVNILHYLFTLVPNIEN